MNLVGEPRLEEICFFMGIPKCGRLWAKREVIYEGHEVSIGEADLLFGGVVVGGGLHLDDHVVVFHLSTIVGCGEIADYDRL